MFGGRYPDFRAPDRAVRIVAMTILLEWLWCVTELLALLPSGKAELGTGLLGIFTYFGLRRYSRVWRTWTLFWAGVGMLFGPVTLLALFAHWRIFHGWLATLGPVAIFLSAAFWFAVSLWRYHELTRPDVRALFYNSQATDPAAFPAPS